MGIAGIAAIAIVGAVISVLLKQYKPEYAVFVRLASGLLIMTLIIAKISDGINGIKELFSYSGETEYFGIMLKALGICLIAQLAADTCRDAGESALASKVELAGKVTVLCLSLPMFSYIAGLIAEVIGAA